MLTHEAVDSLFVDDLEFEQMRILAYGCPITHVEFDRTGEKAYPYEPGPNGDATHLLLVHALEDRKRLLFHQYVLVQLA